MIYLNIYIIIKMGIKNDRGGNKSRKQKRNNGRFDPIYRIEPGQMFAQILVNNGSHFSVLCSDNITRTGRLSGSLRKGPRITTGSFVVITLREFEADNKNCDIIGIGNPSKDIINIFKKNNPTKYANDIEFYNSDDELNDFNNENKVNNEINFDNLDNDDLDINIENLNITDNKNSNKKEINGNINGYDNTEENDINIDNNSDINIDDI